MKVIFVFISMAALLGVNTAENGTATTTSTATNITKPTSTVNNLKPSPSTTEEDPPLESHSTTNKMDGAKTKNISECPITTRLYDNIGEKGDGNNKKNCTEPGEE